MTNQPVTKTIEIPENVYINNSESATLTLDCSPQITENATKSQSNNGGKTGILQKIKGGDFVGSGLSAVTTLLVE
jgi:hypothetical protein